MKKIISSFAALAFLFGFASCSGDLHDDVHPVHEPVTIANADWWYCDVAVYGDNTDTGGIILNGTAVNGSGMQTVDGKMPAFKAKSGGVYYFTVDTLKNDGGKWKINESYQNDNPAYTPVPGTVRFYFYTDATGCNCHVFGNGDAFVQTTWPGIGMKPAGQTDAPVEITPTVTVEGLPDALNGQTLYFTGTFCDWSKPGEEGSIRGTVTDGNIEVSLPKITLSPSVKKSYGGKFVSSGWTKPEICAPDGKKGANVEFSITSTKFNVKGKYVTEVDSGGKIYLWSWKVE